MPDLDPKPPVPTTPSANAVCVSYPIRSAMVAAGQTAPMPFRPKRACRIVGVKLPEGVKVTTARIARAHIDLRDANGAIVRTLDDVLREEVFEAARGSFVVVTVQNDAGFDRVVEGEIVVSDETGDETTAPSIFGSNVANPTKVEALSSGEPVAPVTAAAAAKGAAPRAGVVRPVKTMTPDEVAAAARARNASSATRSRSPASRRPMFDRPATTARTAPGMRPPRPVASKYPAKKVARPRPTEGIVPAPAVAANASLSARSGISLVVLHRGYGELLRAFLLRGAPLQDDQRRGRLERTYILHSLRAGAGRVEGDVVEADVGQVVVRFDVTDLEALVDALTIHREHTLTDVRERMGAQLASALDGVNTVGVDGPSASPVPVATAAPPVSAAVDVSPPDDETDETDETNETDEATPAEPPADSGTELAGTTAPEPTDAATRARRVVPIKEPRASSPEPQALREV
jgi:hypothetical protein